MIAFLDTSALAMRYLQEPGSDDVRRLFRGKHRLSVSRLAFAELAAAVGRAFRSGHLDVEQRDGLFVRLPRDFETLWVIEPRKAIVHSVAALVKKYPLRAYDAVQLATCLRAAAEGATELWVADGVLAEAADAEGLKTVVLGSSSR